MTVGVPYGTLGSAEGRFWSKVERKGPDECWPWTAYVDPTKGYGTFWRGDGRGCKLGAHRTAYEFAYGPVPPGMHVDHKCHNGTDCIGGPTCPHRACCNPKHLEAVTQQENLARGNGGIHETFKTHCPQGHEYTPDNTYNNNGGRGCRICKRIQNRKSKQKRKSSA